MKLISQIGYLAASIIWFTAAAAAHEITLAWDANTEPDVEGYILYWREWSPCPPYDYIDTILATELADPLNPKLRVTNLQKGVIYFFVVTAYDTEGLESGYSNIISTKGEVVQCQRSASGDSSNGGGGGSGWMINESAYGFRWVKESLTALLLFIFACVGFAVFRRRHREHRGFYI